MLPRGVRQANPKDVKRREREKVREGACAWERERTPPPGPLVPLSMCIFFPLGLPYVNRASQECLFVLPEVLTPVLRPSFVQISWAFPLPRLLATAILDSFFLF